MLRKISYHKARECGGEMKLIIQLPHEPAQTFDSRGSLVLLHFGVVRLAKSMSRARE